MSSTRKPTRRKSPAEREAEIVTAASRIAVAEGLDRVTAKRVADELGVVPGLVNHYFPAVDDLVAAAFGFAAATERDALYEAALSHQSPLDQLRDLLAAFLSDERDPVSLLWLDAWQASRRRPALLVEVTGQMEAYSERLQQLIRAGIEADQFRVGEPRASSMRIMAAVDGLSVQAATRTTIDYAPVAELVLRTAERELGLDAGSLAV